MVVLEFVKNSEDSYVPYHHLRFYEDLDEVLYMEILDDSCGITRDAIKVALCLVAALNNEWYLIAKNGKA